MKVLKIIPDTIVDGEGLRTSVYFAGCKHHCKGCHNPESWDFSAGTDMTIDEIIREISKNRYCNVTLTGGDPFYQNPTEMRKLLQKITLLRKTIWIYSGFTFEEIIQSETLTENILRYCDVLVDGRYVAELRNTDLRFRGSENQRIIDVKASLREEKVVLHNKI